MIRYTFFLFLLLSVYACNPPHQDSRQGASSDRSLQPGQDLPTDGEIKVAFYNVENLFDTQDNPERLDEDFLPEGRYEWTEEKYQIKLRNTARVLNALRADIVGLAEVENKQVLEDLVKHPLLQEYGYRFVHEESPDDRGIDVALLYRQPAFQYTAHEAIRAYFPAEPDYRSRDYLLVEGQVKGGERLYLIVNHWPSRREGQEASEPRRLRLAEMVRHSTDSIFTLHKDACMVIMGDFNDDPSNRSLSEVLQAGSDASRIEDDGLFNPMAALFHPDSAGSLTYQGKWNLFDQIILSENLLLSSNPLRYEPASAEVFRPGWMSIGELRGPRRSIFRGKLDEEGFSDHFPVCLVLEATP